MVDFQKRTIEFIKQNRLFNTEKAVLVGVSGGADSVALLHALHKLCQNKELSIDIFAGHINHNLRGKQSDSDQTYVKELCQAMGVELFIRSADVRKYASDNG